jgi:sterol desaturase/sphingolipid hydroxylase (fatty acid hydroxylase superfamily)
MTETFKEALLILTATPIYLIVIAFEIIFSRIHGKKLYSGKGTLTNFYLMMLNMGLDILLRGVCLLVLDFFYRFHVGVINPPVLYWIVLLFAQDFLYYLLHVADHYIRIFWAVHVTHHSSEEFNFTVGFRSSVFQPLYRFIYFIPLSLAGFTSLDIMFMYSATQIYGILVHTQAVGKLGILEYFMVTPSHHRVHHGSNARYLDRNLGMLFIIWDRIFGTFEEEKEPVKFGLTEKIDSHHPATVVFHEWNNIVKDMRKDIPFSLKLKYLFYRPGWSHDGSRKTSDQVRALMQDGHPARDYPSNFSSLSSLPSKTA